MQNSPSLSISPENSLDISEPSNIFENGLNKVKMQRLEHFNTLIAGHLNISSIRNKFEMVAGNTTNFDIILISESINGYKLFRHDRNRFGGRLILYLNEEIPCNLLNNHPILPNAEIICIEFHQLIRKWLLLGCYKPLIQSDLEFIASITKIVDSYLQKFENLFITGDLNMMTENTHLNGLLQIYGLTALMKEPTCYQSQNPSGIDHFLTNCKTLFKHC